MRRELNTVPFGLWVQCFTNIAILPTRFVCWVSVPCWFLCCVSVYLLVCLLGDWRLGLLVHSAEQQGPVWLVGPGGRVDQAPEAGPGTHVLLRSGNGLQEQLSLPLVGKSGSQCSQICLNRHLPSTVICVWDFERAVTCVIRPLCFVPLQHIPYKNNLSLTAICPIQALIFGPLGDHLRQIWRYLPPA
jgi:hypothetical protein